jgi:hypothetical protein
MQNRTCHEASITAVPATLGLRTPSVKPGNHPDLGSLSVWFVPQPAFLESRRIAPRQTKASQNSEIPRFFPIWHSERCDSL